MGTPGWNPPSADIGGGRRARAKGESDAASLPDGAYLDFTGTLSGGCAGDPSAGRGRPGATPVVAFSGLSSIYRGGREAGANSAQSATVDHPSMACGSPVAGPAGRLSTLREKGQATMRHVWLNHPSFRPKRGVSLWSGPRSVPPTWSSRRARLPPDPHHLRHPFSRARHPVARSRSASSCCLPPAPRPRTPRPSTPPEATGGLIAPATRRAARPIGARRPRPVPVTLTAMTGRRSRSREPAKIGLADSARLRSSSRSTPAIASSARSRTSRTSACGSKVPVVGTFAGVKYREDRRALSTDSSSPAEAAARPRTRSTSSAPLKIPVLVLYAPGRGGVLADSS